MTQNTVFMARVEKIITYALGELFPWSPHEGRTSSEMKSPVYWIIDFKNKIHIFLGLHRRVVIVLKILTDS